VDRTRPLIGFLGAIFGVACLLQAQPDPILQALRSRQFPVALDLCSKELTLQPDNARLWLYQGLALHGTGKAKEALTSYRHALRLSPDLLPALEGAAEIEYKIADPECQRTLERIVAQRPDSAPAHGMLGVLAYEQKRCDAAAGHFEKSGVSLNSNAGALWQYGNCLYVLRRPEKASRTFRTLLSLREDDRVRFNLGLSLFDAKKPAEAVEVLRPLASGQRPDSELLSLLAAAHEAAKDTPEALKVLRRAADLYPLEDRHYIDFASICMEHSSLDLGIDVLEVGIKNIPGSARLHATLGALLVRAGKLDRGTDEFQTAQTLAPQDAYGNVGVSLALLQSDQVEESLRLLRQQWAQSQSSPMVSFMLAQALLRAGPDPSLAEFQEAERMLKKTIELNPNHSRAHGLLGKNYAMAGNTTEAIRELETALRLDPADRTSAYQLALLYGKIGKQDLATKWQTRVRELIQADRIAETEGDRYRILKAAPERDKQ
jgi:tetratricopeptide (TPR) repeat protein